MYFTAHQLVFPLDKVYCAVQNLSLPLERAILQASSFRLLFLLLTHIYYSVEVTFCYIIRVAILAEVARLWIFVTFTCLVSLIRDVLRLDLALRRVRETATFSGHGFFFVDRTTLTAMVSTTVTYLIVLFQTPSNGSSDNGNPRIAVNLSSSSG